MPAATTHVEFAKDVCQILTDRQKEKITDMHMFWLGSQGPDMLFFSRASLLPGSLKKWGNRMHDEKVAEVIRCFEEYAKDDSALNSYIAGYLCHYALDSLAHPLICACARHLRETEGVHEGEAHVSMESDIDTWILAQRGRTVSSYDVNRYLKVSFKNCIKLGKMYAHMLNSIFEAGVKERDCILSAAEISFYTRVLSPNDAKYRLFYTIETKASMPHSFSGMMLSRKHDFKVLNIEKKAYPLAFDSSRTISASFPELYGKAVYRAQKLLESHSDEDFTLNFTGVPLAK